MKQDANFLNTLNDWGEILTNTYDDATSSKPLLQFTNDDENDVIYIKNSKNIKTSNFKMNDSLINNSVRISIVVKILNDKALSIYKDERIPICDLQIEFSFYVSKDKENKKLKPFSTLMFIYTERKTNEKKAYGLYGECRNLNYSNYGDDIKKILNSVPELILKYKDPTIKFKPSTLKLLSKRYKELIK